MTASNPENAARVAGGDAGVTRHPLHTDTILLDWLEKFGNVNFDFEREKVSFPLPDSFREADSLREIFRAARTHQMSTEQEDEMRTDSRLALPSADARRAQLAQGIARSRT